MQKQPSEFRLDNLRTKKDMKSKRLTLFTDCGNLNFQIVPLTQESIAQNLALSGKIIFAKA